MTMTAHLEQTRYGYLSWMLEKGIKSVFLGIYSQKFKYKSPFYQCYLPLCLTF